MYAVRAALGSSWIGSLPSCVDSIVLWSGSCTCIGLVDFLMFCSGALTAKKCDVLPVSTIAVEAIAGEGPSAAVEMCLLLSFVSVTCCGCAS